MLIHPRLQNFLERSVVFVLFNTFVLWRQIRLHILRGAWVNIEGVDANKVYAIACCVAYWLDSMGYGVDFKNELKSLLVSYPQVDPAAMGFPDNWISEPLWR